LWLMGSLSPMILFSPTFLSFIQKVHIYLLLNYNLSYIIFFNLVFVFLFLIYFLGFVLKFCFFQFHPSTKVYFVFFFNLALIILIFVSIC
jgi:hypothetical protein